jgi:DNA polymerase III epsilon subunit family exonuclease
MQNFRNLIPDSALLSETVRLLRTGGGRARTVEVAEAVLQIPAPDPALATALVAELAREDWRLRVCEKTDQVELLCEDDDCRRLDESDFVVFDLETTGPKTPPCRVMELGACRVSGGRIVAEFRTLVNPRTPIPPFITALTGISDQMVAGAPTFEEVAADWLTFAGAAVLVAPNAVFDVRFINHELSLVFPNRRMANAHLCTVSLARRLMPELKSFRLHALAAHFAVQHRVRHRAGDDARATAEVFLFFLEHLRRHGVSDVAGARRYKAPVVKAPQPESSPLPARPAAEPV